jgi:hypothetical protein
LPLHPLHRLLFRALRTLRHRVPLPHKMHRPTLRSGPTSTPAVVGCMPTATAGCGCRRAPRPSIATASLTPTCIRQPTVGLGTSPRGALGHIVTECGFVAPGTPSVGMAPGSLIPASSSASEAPAATTTATATAAAAGDPRSSLSKLSRKGPEWVDGHATWRSSSQPSASFYGLSGACRPSARGQRVRNPPRDSSHLDEESARADAPAFALRAERKSLVSGRLDEVRQRPSTPRRMGVWRPVEVCGRRVCVRLGQARLPCVSSGGEQLIEAMRARPNRPP